MPDHKLWHKLVGGSMCHKIANAIGIGVCRPARKQTGPPSEKAMMAAPAIGITGTDFSSSSFFAGGGGGGGAFRFVRTFPPILPMSAFESELVGSYFGVGGRFFDPFFERDFADLGREDTVRFEEGD